VRDDRFGRKGLRVSKFTLGTMTFGTDRGWGSGPDEARRILNVCLEQGGNIAASPREWMTERRLDRARHSLPVPTGT
jgi:aryl-alcohol dehydrogenase-like predicted oxidoreductase